MNAIENLAPEEQQVLQDAIPYITILVAGADDEIDPAEVTKAEKITKIRSYEYVEELMPFYKKVGETYSEKLQALLDKLPKETEQRQAQLTSELEKVNPILAKLDTELAHMLYESYLSFAKHVAEAAGGIFGYLRIGNKEHKAIQLPMIEAR